ncbi:MAG: ATP-dependent DNA helicase RecG [Acidobacteria bacterium]|nr:ATP-dependent DNA helicase RecG [Acidobacteriota bacterium]
MLDLSTPLNTLHHHGVAKLSSVMAGKLADAVAQFAARPDPADATVEDLLYYLPARYEDRSNLIGIDKLEDGMEASVDVVVRRSAAVRVGRNRDRRKPPLFVFEITAGDAERLHRPVVVKWFISGKSAQPIAEYYLERFKQGTRFVVHGLWEYDERGAFVLKNAKSDEIEVLPGGGESFGLLVEPTPADPDITAEEDDDLSDPDLATIHTARRVPIHRKLGPFSAKRLREIMHSVLDRLADIADPLPASVVEGNDLLPFAKAIREIHFPPDDVPISQYAMHRAPAQRRMIFDEFFWLTFRMQLIRGERRREPKGTSITIDASVRERLQAILPFHLTGAQKRVLKEIFDDLRSDSPMNRLIQGDVGSGKTIVAILAMMAAMENGYQTAMMVPTEILAEQHFRNAARLLSPAGHRVEMLTGSTRAAERRKILADLDSGEINMLIGTHALIQDSVHFDKLGLVVIDEQHRFGVVQRAKLREMGTDPDVLVMTATPIPRSLAITVYGDLDVSVIDELPPGRTPIKTVVCGEDKREGVYRGIRREIGLGRQVYVVYPLIEESEKLDLKAATRMYEQLRDEVFPDLSVGLLHGRMKPAEKDAVMADFVAGRTQILVSTTVIEVGVDVPNASLMIIEHAERFGLSQLHQLRGRVGRGADQSYCVLLADYKRTAVAKERLGIMEETSDGFRIAEKDLEIRGQGDIFGTRQSGLRSFRIANIVRDLDLLVAARREAEKLIADPPRDAAELVRFALSDKNVGLASIG